MPRLSRVFENCGKIQGMAGEEETSLDKGCCDEVSCDSGNGCNSIVVELPRQHGKTSLAIMSALTALKDGKSVLYVTKPMPMPVMFPSVSLSCFLF